MIKVLYLSASAEVGGAEESLLCLLSQLDRSAVEPVLACPASGREVSGSCTAGAENVFGGAAGNEDVSAGAAGGDDGAQKEEAVASGADVAGAGSAPAASEAAESSGVPTGSASNDAGELEKRVRALGIEVVRMPLVRFHRTINPLRLLSIRSGMIGMRRRVAEFVKERGIHVIHANSVTAALQAGGAPLVCHLRDLSLPYLAGMDLSRRVSVAIAPSNVVVRMATPWFDGAVRRIPNGVDARRFRPGAAQGGAGERYILMAGNLVPWKRHDLFIETLAWLRARDATVRGVIAGCDLFGEHADYVRDLRKMACDLGLEYAIDWAGRVDQEKMPELIAGASVLVHPAEGETFCRVVAEAMACGTPVVAAGGEALGELLERGGGKLVEPGDVKAMTNAAWDYLRQPGAARKAGKVGRATVLGRYTLQRHVHSVCSVYSALAGSVTAEVSGV